MDQRVTTKLQQKALLKLMDLKFTIQYKKGASNNAADALSRVPHNEVTTIVSTSTVTPTWLEKLQEGYADDPKTKQLLTELSITPDNGKGYSLLNGIIRYHGRIWVGNNLLAQNHIMKALHSSAIGGHSGIQATYHRIK